MSAIADSLIPVLALIVVGFALRQSAFLPETLWPAIEKLAYFVLFPALLISSLGRQTLGDTPWLSILTVAGITQAAVVVALLGWHRLRSDFDGPLFTSVFQGAVRFNTYIALAIAEGFFGTAGLEFGAIAAGFIIVPSNILCVAALSVWGSKRTAGKLAFVRDVAGNPLIIACAIGWFLSLSHIGLPRLAGDSLEFVGRAALPCGLLAVGAALRLDRFHEHLRPMLFSSAIQFGLKPILAATLIGAVGLGGIPAGVLFICLMVPTASSSVVLARQLGGDTDAMASIVTFQTLLAFFAMPAIAWIMLVR